MRLCSGGTLCAPPPLLIHFWWIRLVSKKCHVCQILDAGGWICPNQEDKDDFNFPGLYVWIELNEITMCVESVTWQTALYLAIVCAQGFVNVYTVYITPQSLSHKKQIFSMRQCKGGVSFHTASCRSRNSGVRMPEHRCCHRRGIHTHLFTSTHSDYHVNGAFCNRWMCQTRDGAFTFWEMDGLWGT